MVKKLLPVLLGILGLLIGGAAGFFLRPAPEPAAADAAAGDGHAAPAAGDHGEAPAEGEEAVLPEYAKLQNQFIIPVMERGRVSAMVIMSMSLEVETGATPEVYNAEPKLRDVFLQVLFDHANAGGFAGVYTDVSNLVVLREALTEAAKKIMGDKVKDVLITEIMRQDT